MKKYIALLLALVLALSLAACGGSEDPQGAMEITMGAKEDPVQETQTSGQEQAAGWTFLYEGVELAIDQPYDASKLPECENVFENPDCALEGKNTVYGFPGVEITTYDQGQGEFLYSVYLLDDTLSTPEGLKIGDELSKVTQLYGQDFQDNDGEYVYTAGGMMLIILHDGANVSSIEYLMVI